MKESLQTRLKNFDGNNRILMKKYWATNASLSAVGSAAFLRNGKAVDPAQMDVCKSILKKHFGIFSNMRGLLEVPLLSEMACREDPEAFITQVGEIYKDLTKGRIFSSDYDVLCAMMLHSFREKVNLGAVRESIRRIYQKMKTNHPLLTSREDLPVAALFALSGKDEDTLLNEMEACYRILKPGFFMRGDCIQTLCAILATQEGIAKSKCERVLALCDALKKNGCSVRWADSLPIAAGLSSLGKPVSELASEVCEAESWLRGKKGFGPFHMGKQGRLSFAMLMVLEDELGEGTAGVAFASSALTSIILTEIILSIIIVCMVMSSASSSAASTAHS